MNRFSVASKAEYRVLLMSLMFIFTIFSSIHQAFALEYFTIDSYNDWVTKNSTRPINTTPENITPDSTAFTNGHLVLDFNLSDIIIANPASSGSATSCKLGPGVASAEQCQNKTGSVNINSVFQRNESINYSIYARNFSIDNGITVSLASFNHSSSVGNQSGNYTIFSNETRHSRFIGDFLKAGCVQ